MHKYIKTYFCFRCFFKSCIYICSRRRFTTIEFKYSDCVRIHITYIYKHYKYIYRCFFLRNLCGSSKRTIRFIRSYIIVSTVTFESGESEWRLFAVEEESIYPTSNPATEHATNRCRTCDLYNIFLCTPRLPSVPYLVMTIISI